MPSVTLYSHVGADGVLTLRPPAEFKDADVEVVVTIKPTTDDDLEALAQSNGWPPGFFEQTFGSLKDFPEIDPEGDYEVREELQ